MTLLFLSFAAGVLTVLAPCILPLLPIVIGRSSQGGHKYRPLIVSASLAVAVIVFTLLLKASTAFINVPPKTWGYISGGIIILFGITALFPTLWETLSAKLKLGNTSNKWLGTSSRHKGILGDILVGFSLGPIFSSCSPTYFLILATVLPQSYAKGVLYLTAYAVGLSLMLMLVGFLGKKITSKLAGVSNPKGWFKRGLGVLFIIVGIFIITGSDKKLQACVLESGFFDITKIEQQLIQQAPMMDTENTASTAEKIVYPRYQEITNPAGFVNSAPFLLSDYIGKKVILLDFMTYSCINCQRTFPYLNAWHKQYEDDGLMIIGIHTPEFAFEHKKENVEEAAKEFGLEFPLVLDNDYGTWKAYGNNYWPRKYIIDINGNIVYDHIGEGAYEETEQVIRTLLEKRKEAMAEPGMLDETFAAPNNVETVSRGSVGSPETYFGYFRNKNLGVAVSQTDDVVTFEEPTTVKANQLYLVGTWKITGEYAEAVSDDATIIYRYSADKVFLVMDADEKKILRVFQDDTLLPQSIAGEHVQNGKAEIENEQLYRLIDNETAGAHTMKLEVEAGIRAYAFTFG